MSSNTEIEFDDIQGLVRFGHGQLSASAFLLLRVVDVDAAKRWLSNAEVTDAVKSSPLPNRVLQIAFTASGLRALGLPDAIIGQFSGEFISGLAGDDNRSRRLGDSGANAPANWHWGGDEDNTPHLLLMLYAQPQQFYSELADLRDEQFRLGFSQLAELLSHSNGSQEPFGFVDGISQPALDWQQAVSTDVHQRDRYSNRLALGEILLGYRNEYGLYTQRPLLDDDADLIDSEIFLPAAEDEPERLDLGRNGTYLVMRQLAQDVRGFWQFAQQQANGDEQQREQLAAAMVGRQRDGTPLVSASVEPIDGTDVGNRQNHFTYDRDPHGQACPIGAHVRRANPRTGDFPVGVSGLLTRLIRTLGFGRRHDADDLVASSRFHRLLRRGRAYGVELPTTEALQPPPEGNSTDEERGLHFICLGANISRQFEFVQNAWIMSSKFAGLPSESDPLLGNREALLDGQASDSFSLPRAGAAAQRLHSLPQFVKVKGGAYFFLPGIRALKYISR